MFLNEIATSDEVKIKKINKVLDETYGFTLASEIESGKLNQLYTKIADDLYNLKLNLATAQDPVYVQKILVQEGLRILIARKNKQLDEAAMIVGRGGRKLELVVNKLAEYVFKACDIGDTYETAIADAMRAYELLPYRFERELVEHELRKVTVDECTDTVIGDPIADPLAVEGVMEDDECQSCKDWDDDDKKVCKDCMPLESLEESTGTQKILFSGHTGIMNSKPVRNMFANLGGQVDDNGDGIVEITVDIEPERAEKIGAWLEAFDRNGDLYGGYIFVNENEIEEANIDRYAERDWVRGMQKDKARAAGDDELELSLVGNDEEEADDFFSYQSKKTKRNEMKEGYVKELRKILEAETDQAESLIAAKSFSQELQDMVEKLGRLVNEDLPAVADQMRDSHGADVATGFEDTVSSTLNGIMDSLRSSKQELDNSVSTIADGGMPSVGSDMDDFSDAELGGEEELDLDVDADVELDLGDEELGDEFGGEEVGDIEEPLGRAKKESMQIIAKKIVEAEQKLARIKSKQ